MRADTERLKRMVEDDNGGAVRDALRVAESDVMAVLCEFMSVTGLDMRLDNADGKLTLNITAAVDKIYGVGKIIGE